MSPTIISESLVDSDAPSTTLTLVLDTNVVLDWLLFADPLLDSLTHGVFDSKVEVLTHVPALNELQRVLGYPAFKLDPNRQATLFEHYRCRTRISDLPPDFTLHNLLLPTDFPDCKDPDDQHFLALCYHTHADALITRDKALLALRKRARKFGVTVMDVRQLSTILPVV
jgi:putative PIN family toxin of toxin-antitoxin system